MTLLTRDSFEAQVRYLAGNKGLSLYRLTRQGVPVPPWAILGTDLFQTFLLETGLGEKIRQWLEEASDPRVLAARIAEAFRSTPPGPALEAAVATALARLGHGPLAVRSSGVEEDGERHSFAGQFDTFLGVQGHRAVVDHVLRCWASVWSERSLGYRRQHGMDPAAAAMGVVIQQLIPADRSGVVFTANPSNGDPDQMVVSAVYGLGEGLVSGAVDADTLIIDRMDDRIIETVIGDKARRFQADGVVEVPEEQRARLCLNDDELARLLAHARQLEEAAGCPQDIEWCIGPDGRLWILQARPVTTPLLQPRGEVQIWDNSNIVENYPGVTGHLTFTFARRVYGEVFRRFCRSLGIPRRQMAQMDGFLDGVLGHLNGRVYYNLLHWYKLSGLAPFQKVGRRMMELQMGVDEALNLEDFAPRIRPYTTRNRLEGAWIQARTAWAFAGHFLGLKGNVARFRRYFYRVYDHYDALDYGRLPAGEVYGHYRHFEQRLMDQWAAMIALESAIGLSYGLLRGLIRRWLPDTPAWFEVAVIGGIDGMESVAPARRLGELADRVRADADLERLIRDTPSRQTYRALVLANRPDFLARVEAYIDEFGYRSQNELKLEEPDLREAPGLLFDMLKAALASPQGPVKEPTRGQDVDALLERLNPLQRWLFQRARNRVRTAIQARETVRLCRSRAFGVVRRMFRALGDDLARSGLLEDGRDVFHLGLEELAGCFEGATSHRELKPLVAQRKADQEAYRKMEPLPARFVTRGPVAAWLQDPARWQTPSDDIADGALKGTPCSPGRAQGEAKVVQEADQFDGGVLVTYRTDPGWIPVFPSAQALLVERGSPLTHAAIVARELGIPTIVQIPGLTRRVATGMHLAVDGNSGLIDILEPVT